MPLSLTWRRQAAVAVGTLFVLLILIPVTASVTKGWAEVKNAASHASEALNAGVEPATLHFLQDSGPYERCVGMCLRRSSAMHTRNHVHALIR